VVNNLGLFTPDDVCYVSISLGGVLKNAIHFYTVLTVAASECKNGDS
jgi:hypothetical protein